MKKILTLLLILLLPISLAACSMGESAEQATNNALKAIKQMDEETLSKYLEIDELIEKDSDSSDPSSIGEEEMLVIFESIEYKINSSEGDGDNAVVNVDITNIDMANVFGTLLQESISFAFSNAFSSSSMTDEEMDMKMTQVFFDIIEQNKENTVTNNVDIKLHKTDKDWKINLDDTLQNALMGNLFNVLNSIDDSFSEFGESEENQEIQENANIIRKSIGEEVEFTTIIFNAISVEEVETLIPEYGDSISAEEGTKFVVVDVEIMNITKEEIVFNSDFVLVDNEERKFNPFEDAIWYVDDDIDYRDLAPSIKEKGKIVYLVPETSNSYYISAGKAGTNDVFEIVLK